MCLTIIKKQAQRAMASNPQPPNYFSRLTEIRTWTLVGRAGTFLILGFANWQYRAEYSFPVGLMNSAR